jgi:hypothetical protein
MLLWIVPLGLDSGKTRVGRRPPRRSSSKMVVGIIQW